MSAPEVIAESNGHKWVNKAFLSRREPLVCCRECGVVRRADDLNNQCRGKVRVALRSEGGHKLYGARGYPL